jgi:hypothetical protein
MNGMPAHELPWAAPDVRRDRSPERQFVAEQAGEHTRLGGAADVHQQRDEIRLLDHGRVGAHRLRQPDREHRPTQTMLVRVAQRDIGRQRQHAGELRYRRTHRTVSLGILHHHQPP